MIVESIQIMGHNVYYIPRESFDEGDMVFGEYSKSKFNRAYIIEAYISNVAGYDGQGDFFSKFGLEIRHESNFVLSRRSFARHVPTSIRGRPQEGDLLYVPVLHKMFELKFVEQEGFHHQAGRSGDSPYVWELRCENFRFSQDKIATGVEEIDVIGEDSSYKMRLNLGAGSGIISENDTVFQSTDGTWVNNYAHATVSDWFKANGTTYIYNINGIFAANSNVYSSKSNGIYILTSVGDEKIDHVKFDVFDNHDLDTGADLILDLTENNPFGTP